MIWFSPAHVEIFPIGWDKWRHQVFYRIFSKSQWKKYICRKLRDVTSCDTRTARTLTKDILSVLNRQMSEKTQNNVCIKAMWRWRILFCCSKTFSQWRSLWKSEQKFIFHRRRKKLKKYWKSWKFSFVPWKVIKRVEISWIWKQVMWRK